MMWGYGYEAIWWMLLSMIVYSFVGVVVVGALLWVVTWAVTHWLQGPVQRVAPETASDSDIPALASRYRRTDNADDANDSSQDRCVGLPEHSSFLPSPDMADDAVLSRR